MRPHKPGCAGYQKYHVYCPRSCALRPDQPGR
jgi:hypothetical protein